MIYIFFYVWSCWNLHHLELYWNSYCNRNILGSWGLFPLVRSLLPSLVFGSCCHLYKLFTVSKILPKLLWSACRTGQQRMPFCFLCGRGSVLNKAWSFNENIFLNAVAVEICEGKKSILTNCVLNQHYLKGQFELLIISESSSHVIF